jgi:Xaa-Pro dipeptidase
VGAFEEHSYADLAFGFRDWDDPVVVLAGQIQKRCPGLKRIGLDFNSYCMTARRFQQLKALLSDVEFVDVGEFFLELRVRKTAEEIVYMRQAASAADHGLAAAVAALGPGRHQRDGIAAASAEYVLAGADTGRVGFVTAGRGASFFHRPITEGLLETHDVVHFEFAPRVKGYCARMMRPVVIGEAAAEQEDIATQLLEIQDRQIAAMVPGAVASDVDSILRSEALARGLVNQYDHGTGYALGHVPWASPRTSDLHRRFTPAAIWKLEAGMVFHMIAAAKGIAFSESILVGEGGPERLGRSDRRLFIGTNTALDVTE